MVDGCPSICLQERSIENVIRLFPSARWPTITDLASERMWLSAAEGECQGGSIPQRRD